MHILATISSKAMSSLNWEIAVFRRFFPIQNSFYLVLLHAGILTFSLLFPKNYHSPAFKHGCRNITELKATAGAGAIKLSWQK